MFGPCQFDLEGDPGRKKYDAIVIGAGQAGSPLAQKLTQEGLHTAIVERQLFGGTCVNVGCIPTKTLVGGARVAELARRGSEFGVRTGAVEVDGELLEVDRIFINVGAQSGALLWCVCA